MRLGQVLVARAFAFDEIGNRVESQPVDALVQPEVHDALDEPHHVRVVEVQVGLVAEEPVPVELLRDRVLRPVRRLGVREDDARAGVLRRIVRPHVIVALLVADRRLARGLEPRVLIRRVIDDELGDDAQSASMRLVDERLEILARAVVGMDVAVVGDVVAIVLAGRRIERQQPDGVDPQLLDVIELAEQSAEIADAIVVAVEECTHVHFVDDGVFVPEGVGHGPAIFTVLSQKIIEIRSVRTRLPDAENMRRCVRGVE